MMLLKCFTQYAGKFGKLSNSHRTGKGQFSFQSQRRIMPKNVQTTEQLCSFHMLVRLCSKSFKLGFNSNVNWELPEITLIIFFAAFAAKDGEALYSQQK